MLMHLKIYLFLSYASIWTILLIKTEYCLCFVCMEKIYAIKFEMCNAHVLVNSHIHETHKLYKNILKFHKTDIKNFKIRRKIKLIY